MRETKKQGNEITVYERETYRPATKRLMAYTTTAACRKREKSRKNV